MKSEYSPQWIGSVQPRKQRKYLANAPLHIKHKFLSANLSKALRQKYGTRSIPLRKGDEVLVMRGSFKKKKAKITDVNVIKCTVTIEGLQRARKDGTKVNIPFKPSNLQIQSVVTDDKMRFGSVPKTKAAPVKTEKKEAPAKQKTAATTPLPKKTEVKS